MSRIAAVYWCLFGIPVAVGDAWLSIQSMVGLLDPTNRLAFTLAAAAGLGLTCIAVVAPVVDSYLREGRTTGSPALLPVLLLIWYTLTAVDLATSLLGAAWYGVLGHQLDDPIEIGQIHWDWSNRSPTAIYFLVVLVVAGICIKLGQALRVLSKKKRNDRATRPLRRDSSDSTSDVFGQPPRQNAESDREMT